MPKFLIVILLLLTACAPATTTITQLQISSPRSAACTINSTETPINGIELPSSFDGNYSSVAMLENSLKKVGFRIHLDAIDHADIYVWGTISDWKNSNGDSVGRVGNVDLTITDTHSGLPLLAVRQPAVRFLLQAPTTQKVIEQLMQVLLTKFCQKV